jgi:hypothetical protein
LSFTYIKKKKNWLIGNFACVKDKIQFWIENKKTQFEALVRFPVGKLYIAPSEF